MRACDGELCAAIRVRCHPIDGWERDRPILNHAVGRDEVLGSDLSVQDLAFPAELREVRRAFEGAEVGAGEERFGEGKEHDKKEAALDDTWYASGGSMDVSLGSNRKINDRVGRDVGI